MCLEIFKPKYPDEISEPKIAKKNITCYKLFRQVGMLSNPPYLESPYQNSVYEIGKKKTSKLICYMVSCGQAVSIGLHSFNNYQSAIDNTSGWVMSKIIIVKCIIPKGAKYYTGTFDFRYPCRASTELIPIEILK